MTDAGQADDDSDGALDKDRLIEELREAVLARDEFVSIAAHELRNPMTPILMQVHNLVTAARDPRRCRPQILAPRLELHVQEGIVGMWDRLATEQVAENLLSNALKFGAGRPVTLTLRSDSRAAQLTVRDQGIGISEEDRARIFQRFERAVTRREHGGFGVGLWLVNQLVVAMGGSISIESAPGKGATFVVTLPLGAEGAGT